jgi:hypothetical protein
MREEGLNERERRLGENEALYREVNERVRDLEEQFGLDREYLKFVCECAQLECMERIQLTAAEYEHVRSEPELFALKHGHEMPDVESVVEENPRFIVVRKHEGGPAELARARDPR